MKEICLDTYDHLGSPCGWALIIDENVHIIWFATVSINFLAIRVSNG